VWIKANRIHSHKVHWIASLKMGIRSFIIGSVPRSLGLVPSWVPSLVDWFQAVVNRFQGKGSNSFFSESFRSKWKYDFLIENKMIFTNNIHSNQFQPCRIKKSSHPANDYLISPSYGVKKRLKSSLNSLSPTINPLKQTQHKSSKNRTFKITNVNIYGPATPSVMMKSMSKSWHTMFKATWSHIGS